jgi:hypothetical protein
MAKLKRIHVNQHNIRANAKAGNQDLPVFTIKTYDRNVRADFVSIDGPSRIVYNPNDPLSCGAKVWIETNANVSYTNKDGQWVT